MNEMNFQIDRLAVAKAFEELGPAAEVHTLLKRAQEIKDELKRMEDDIERERRTR